MYTQKKRACHLCAGMKSNRDIVLLQEDSRKQWKPRRRQVEWKQRKDGAKKQANPSTPDSFICINGAGYSSQTFLYSAFSLPTLWTYKGNENESGSFIFVSCIIHSSRRTRRTLWIGAFES